MTNADNLNEQAKEGRLLIMEALDRQKERLEDNAETYIKNSVVEELKRHGVDEEDIDEQRIMRDAKEIRTNIEHDKEDKQELEELKSNLSFMPYINSQVFEEMAEEKEE